jgi:putative tryptophan/tyrosine transport system substrate-binding protein
MRRRAFIGLIGGAAALPLTARAQETDRVRRVAVLVGNGIEGDAPTQARIDAFRAGLAMHGWNEGRNLRIDFRYGGGDVRRIATAAAEVTRLAPDAIVTQGAAPTAEAQRQTHTIPIVVAGAGDVAANGLVKNLAHPEGNITGVANVFASIGGKWLELLKEAAPGVQRVAFLRPIFLGNAGEADIPAIRDAAQASATELVVLPYQNTVELVRAVDAFAAEGGGGIIVGGPPYPASRGAILQLVAQHRLPAIQGFKEFAVEGGLMSYGTDILEVWQRTSSFVDRILRGTKVSELPVEFPTKFELVINVKAAKAIGLNIPERLLLRADEVIE